LKVKSSLDIHYYSQPFDIAAIFAGPGAGQPANMNPPSWVDKSGFMRTWQGLSEQNTASRVYSSGQHTGLGEVNNYDNLCNLFAKSRIFKVARNNQNNSAYFISKYLEASSGKNYEILYEIACQGELVKVTAKSTQSGAAQVSHGTCVKALDLKPRKA
jgi:hypothetical protein